jgi:hypothetical protein
MLDVLDHRILLSAGAIAPSQNGAVAGALPIQNSANAGTHVITHSKAGHHEKLVHDARMNHERIALSAQGLTVSTPPSSSPALVSGSVAGSGATSPAILISSSPVGSASIATPALALSTATPATVSNSTGPATAPTVPANSNPGDIQNGPLAKAGADLIAIYQEFEQNSGATLSANQSGDVEVIGSNVGVDIHSTGADFSSFVSAMTDLGMQVQTQDAAHGIVEGLLPIGQLPAAAQNSLTASISAIYIPNRDSINS